MKTPSGFEIETSWMFAACDGCGVPAELSESDHICLSDDGSYSVLPWGFMFVPRGALYLWAERKYEERQVQSLRA